MSRQGWQLITAWPVILGHYRKSGTNTPINSVPKNQTETLNALKREDSVFMRRCTSLIVLVFLIAPAVAAQTMTFSTNQSDYQLTNVFSDVDLFDITVIIDAPLAAGIYVNPDIVSVNYTVNGALVPGTPSGFPAFALQRSMTGEEFYAQGSSLSFQISTAAVLSDGVQIEELVGTGIVLTYNAKEVGNGRFHPALLELSANGTGRIQNADNIISENPFQQIDFGEEYVNDLMFDPGNTTVITGAVRSSSRGSSGAISWIYTGVLLFLFTCRAVSRRARAKRQAGMIGLS
ncbi:MAG: hypothetical protein ACR2Q3_10180 [Woeseiaceae bacterium]